MYQPGNQLNILARGKRQLCALFIDWIRLTRMVTIPTLKQVSIFKKIHPSIAYYIDVPEWPYRFLLWHFSLDQLWLPGEPLPSKWCPHGKQPVQQPVLRASGQPEGHKTVSGVGAESSQKRTRCVGRAKVMRYRHTVYLRPLFAL